MTLQIKNSASESLLINEDSFTFPILTQDIKISSSVKREAKLFLKRNILAKNECCPRCLKAHLVKHAKQSLNILQALLVEEIIPFEAGHHGYYMDAEEVIKI